MAYPLKIGTLNRMSNRITLMVFDYIYELIDKDDKEVLSRLAEYPEDYFSDNFGDLRTTDEEIAYYIWEDGYNNIEWDVIASKFQDILDTIEKEEEEANTTDSESAEEDEI
jgi:hypothetical protein